MNIFYLDKNVKTSCVYHVDKHIVKMPLETAQLLCGVHHVYGTSNIPYKKTHINHPSSIWVRQNINNYNYLVELGMGLCEEFKHRYNKDHGCKRVIEWCKINSPSLPDLDFTPPTPAMDEQFKIYINGNIDSLLSYRNYYKKAKNHLFSWKNRSTPEWV